MQCRGYPAGSGEIQLSQPGLPEDSLATEMNSNSKVWIRCDASNQIGFGHVRRCLTLARALQRLDLACGFLTRSPVELAGAVGNEPFEVVAIRDDRSEIQQMAQLGSVLVIDLLDVGEKYQRELHDAGVDFLTIDGSGRSPCWGKALLDPTVSQAGEEAVCDLMRRKGAKVLRGAKYALLEDSTSTEGATRMANRVLVSMGGGDDRGAIKKTLESLGRTSADLEIIVQCMANNPNLLEIEREAEDSRHRVSVLIDQPVINHEAARSALAIAAGGITCYELAMMGIPFVVCPIAENQIRSGRAWELMGIAVYAGCMGELSEIKLSRIVDGLLKDQAVLDKMKWLGLNACDGKGANRVAREIASWIEFS